jgi:hypothetical protein
MPGGLRRPEGYIAFILFTHPVRVPLKAMLYREALLPICSTVTTGLDSYGPVVTPTQRVVEPRPELRPRSPDSGQRRRLPNTNPRKKTDAYRRISVSERSLVAHDHTPDRRRARSRNIESGDGNAARPRAGSGWEIEAK